MGYFSNGSEGMDYEARYCSRCVHEGGPDGPGCAVWGAHLFANYAECNNKDSILHQLIPRDARGENMQCAMFYERGRRGGGQPEPVPVPLTIVKAA
jgi:hypothetical protein